MDQIDITMGNTILFLLSSIKRNTRNNLLFCVSIRLHHSIVYEAIAEKRKEQLDPHNPRDFLEAYMTQREDFEEKVFTSKFQQLRVSTLESHQR